MTLFSVIFSCFQDVIFIFITCSGVLVCLLPAAPNHFPSSLCRRFGRFHPSRFTRFLRHCRLASAENSRGICLRSVIAFKNNATSQVRQHPSFTGESNRTVDAGLRILHTHKKKKSSGTFRMTLRKSAGSTCASHRRKPKRKLLFLFFFFFSFQCEKESSSKKKLLRTFESTQKREYNNGTAKCVACCWS